MENRQLHLGCGLTRQEGWINCDLYPVATVTDVCFDLQAEWPFPDDSITLAYASHVLEHLPDFWSFFREAHRVLCQGAHLLLRVPYGGSRMAWSDVTHVRPWFPESFCFLQPGYAEETRNAMYQWSTFFSIELVQVRLGPSMRRWLKWPLVRRWVLAQLDHLPQRIDELYVHLKPLKTPEEVVWHRNERKGNFSPIQYCMYEHQYKGVALEKTGRVHLKPFGTGHAIWTGGHACHV